MRCPFGDGNEYCSPRWKLFLLKSMYRLKRKMQWMVGKRQGELRKIFYPQFNELRTQLSVNETYWEKIFSRSLICAAIEIWLNYSARFLHQLRNWFLYSRGEGPTGISAPKRDDNDKWRNFRNEKFFILFSPNTVRSGAV